MRLAAGQQIVRRQGSTPQAAITMTGLSQQSYGDAPTPISATGGASGQRGDVRRHGQPDGLCTVRFEQHRRVNERDGLCPRGWQLHHHRRAGGQRHLRCRAQHNAILRRQPSHADGHRVERHNDVRCLDAGHHPGDTGFVNADGHPRSSHLRRARQTSQAERTRARMRPTAQVVDPRYTFDYTAGTLTIEKASTSVGLTSTVGAGVKGQPLTFMAAVAVTAPGSGHPGGTVMFKDGSTTISDLRRSR